ncbi:hypothetical protein V6N13_038653 [Hibiscus sabdariffa]
MLPRLPDFRVALWCWAFSASVLLPLRSTCLGPLLPRLRAHSPDALRQSKRVVWCARARSTAYFAAWPFIAARLLVITPVVVTRDPAAPVRRCPRPFSCCARLLVVVQVVAKRVLVAPARRCPRPFSCCTSVPFPWHASFPLVFRFATPCIVALLPALDLLARALWPRPLFCVPKIVVFLGTNLVSLAQPRCRPLTCVSRLFPPWSASLLFWVALFKYCLYLSRANASASNPVAPVVAAPAARTPPAPAAASDADNLHGSSAPSETADLMEEAVVDASLEPDALEPAADRSTLDDAPYDPMVHTETSDMLEEALEISRDCVLLADLTGVIQANVEDLVNEAIPEAADSIIWDVAASILGVSASPDTAVASSRPAPMPTTSAPNPGLSKSAPAGSRRAAMPMVPEHHEFDEWCAAQSRTPVAAQNQPAVARASSIPPLRPHKRQASSSDPSRAKRSRPSTSSTTWIPSVPKAGMSSVNNSSAETARQSLREK